ncbi:MAG: hypothetical protein B7Y88_02835 [Sphingomonadales bacterium 32-64-17]|nr:MAG: hypothetical protein B7Y88_02835 [Sphingomonadales bacterium 32-64-17]
MAKKGLWQDESGTSAIEYVALAALVAVGLIAILTTIGDETSAKYSEVDTAFAAMNDAAPAPAPAPRQPIRTRDKH